MVELKQFAISDARFSQIGSIFEKVLKIAVIVSAFLCLAGFLGMIFITLSPTVPELDIKKHDINPNPDEMVNSSVTPLRDGTYLWVAEFIEIPDSPGLCVESYTGYEVACTPSSEGGLWNGEGIVQVSDGRRYFLWDCHICSRDCFWCNNRGSECAPDSNSTVCTCKACNCDHEQQTSYCEVAPSTEAPARDLDPKFQTFAIITDMVYLMCIFMILLAELDITMFLEKATLLTYWPVRGLLQVFVSVQMINNSSALELSGNHESSAHILSILGGWIMFSAGLVQFVFFGVFARKWKTLKYCAIFCFLIILVIVPVGISLGTTADPED